MARFCRYLPEFGIRPIVLTINNRFREALDNTVQSIPELYVKRTEVRQTPADWYRRAKARLAVRKATIGGSEVSVMATRSKSSVRQHVSMLLQFFGPDSGWYQPAVEAGRKLIREESIDAILSSSPPAVSHRIALRLKKDFDLPWLADFRDPWAHSAYWNDGPPWWRYINNLLESRCVRGADRVICNTERLRQNFLQFYSELPQRKFATITNGFVDSGPPREQAASHDPVCFFCTLDQFTLCAASTRSARP